jgi:hypothetical protein
VKKPTLIQRADDQHDRDQADGADEDRPPVAAVDVGVDEQPDQERHSADRHVDELPLQVVVGVALDVEARHAGDRPEAHGDEPRHTGEEQPVERAQHGDERQPLVAMALQASPLRSGVFEHQRMVPINRSGSRSLSRS